MSNEPENITLDEVLKVFREADWEKMPFKIGGIGDRFHVNVNGLSAYLTQLIPRRGDTGPHVTLIVNYGGIRLAEYCGHNDQRVSDLPYSVKRKFDDIYNTKREEARRQAREIVNNALNR